MNERKSSSPRFPDPEYVGDHLVIDRTDWVPGAPLDSHPGGEGPSTYTEPYFRCVRCGLERRDTRDFPEACEADRDDPSEGPRK